ncbi:MAG: glutamate--tRNA ligase [Bacilli bacterium]|nr:glutamate--tRNA ligase [Bacilli bacterium]
MNNEKLKELADLMFPGITKTVEDYEKMYPERNLPEEARVTRFAPSPTGFVHMGSLLSAFEDYKAARDTNGIFYLRIEDTDGKRSIENGITGILNDLKNFDIVPMEGMIDEENSTGEYGPYIQSERQEIYHAFAKELVLRGLAYPCFCTAAELDEIREIQELNKERIGYYGSFAKCRSLSIDEAIDKIKAGAEFTVRLKSQGDFNKKIILHDEARGDIEFPENDLDIVLIKSTDKLPTYHFAHLVDDHLMRTTHVMRGEEWIASFPIHAELFKVFNFKLPKYVHLGIVMKIDETGTRRKLSKRKDKEASVEFYHKEGIPSYAVKLYLMTIANSNFEEWLDNNPSADLEEFKFDFKKISTSGSLFDVEKLLNISKNYLSRLTASEIYDNLLIWTKEFDNEFYEVLLNNKDYALQVFNIERGGVKPRKDYTSYKSIRNFVFYMFDDLFENPNYEFTKITDKKEIEIILNTYLDNYMDLSDKDTWFNKIKEMCDSLGYASNMKEYKKNPELFKGSVADVSGVLRIALTSLANTPDLYLIMTILGKEKIKERFEKCMNSL